MVASTIISGAVFNLLGSERQPGNVEASNESSFDATSNIGSIKPVKVLTSYDEALAKAKSEGKMVLLLAGRENCGNCRTMENRLNDSASGLNQIINDKYVVCYLDIDNPANSKALSKYTAGLNKYKLPLTCAIDPNSSDQYIARFTGIVDAKTLASALSGTPSVASSGTVPCSVSGCQIDPSGFTLFTNLDDDEEIISSAKTI